MFTRYTIAQILYAQGLRAFEERPNYMEKACYQLHGGVTAIHDFAMNLEQLTDLLTLYEEKDKRCLAFILLPDDNGQTPLDIALQNDRVKNIEVML